MSLAENLLNTLPNDGENTAIIANPSEEPHIIIDENRNIIVPQQLRNIAVTGDKDVETVTFDCVRYWDGNDLSTFAIYLNYELPNEEKGSFAPTSIRKFDTIYSFDWTIGSALTKAEGTLKISLTAKETDGSSLLKQWGSFTNSDMEIVRGGSVTTDIPDEEEQDILSQVLSGLNDKLSIESVVQTTGDSEKKVMSQKATTEAMEEAKTYASAAIKSLAFKVNENTTRFEEVDEAIDSTKSDIAHTHTRLDTEIERVENLLGMRVLKNFASGSYVPKMGLLESDNYIVASVNVSVGDRIVFKPNGMMIEWYIIDSANWERATVLEESQYIFTYNNEHTAKNNGYLVVNVGSNNNITPNDYVSEIYIGTAFTEKIEQNARRIEQVDSRIDTEIGDLDAALDAIIEIQNDIITPEITFTVYHGSANTLKARKGMTWGEWVDTEYNTIGITNGNDSGENVGWIYLGVSYVWEGDNSVAATDIIIADEVYEVR